MFSCSGQGSNPGDVLYVRLDPETKRALDAAAEAEDLRTAQLMRRILREWLGAQHQRSDRSDER